MSNMIKIMNNGKLEIAQYHETEDGVKQAQNQFDAIAGRTMYGTLYEMYLERLALTCGLETGTIELVKEDGTVIDTCNLIDFADGKHIPRSANCFPSNYERKPKCRTSRRNR